MFQDSIYDEHINITCSVLFYAVHVRLKLWCILARIDIQGVVMLYDNTITRTINLL